MAAANSFRGGAMALALALVVVSVAGAARPENRRFFSYDPANDATRRAIGAVTFEFDQHLLSTHVLRIRSTEGAASAELKSAGESGLGAGGLDRATGGKPEARDLYEILAKDEGAEMIQALCPGATRAWLATERLRANRDLQVLVVGREAGAPAKLCQTLAFTYHGEWRLPPGPGVDPRTVPHPHFPY